MGRRTWTWNYFRGVYESILKPLFFRLSPERAHYLAMDLLVVAKRFLGWDGGCVAKRPNAMPVAR